MRAFQHADAFLCEDFLGSEKSEASSRNKLFSKGQWVTQAETCHARDGLGIYFPNKGRDASI